VDKHYLTPLFAPESIVVLAESPGDAERQSPTARALRDALMAQPFDGQLSVVDIHAGGSLASLADSSVDLAVITVPPEQVRAALEIAGRMRCRAALIVGTGIDAATATELHKLARRDGIRLLGPNCLGFQRPALHLNASTVGALPAVGSLALVSQSGALTASILDWAPLDGVRFSTVVSLGPNTAVDLADVLDFLASDAQTHSIVVYMEGIVDARRFMSALRAAAHAKPVVVMKAGRRPAGNAAALTHSGTIVGNDDAFDAALRRAGAVRVGSFVQLFSAAKCLASRYRAVGKRLAVVTNGGGPGVMAADWINEIGLELGHLGDAEVNALRPKLGPQASLTGLIDLSEDASAPQFEAALTAAASSPGIDGVLTMYSPKMGTDALAIAQALIDVKGRVDKPFLSCWMGDASVGAARKLLSDHMVPNFRTPESAVGAFGNIATYHQNQQLLQQTPPPLSNLAQPDVEGARMLIESVLAERRKVLTEMESKALLAAFHIPVTKTLLAHSVHEAVLIATQLGFPVALKIDSPDISHKSDVDGVTLNVMTAVGVRDAYGEMLRRVKRAQPEARINGVTIQNMSGQKRGREVCIGLVTDDPFGPVISFGAGGTMVELINDHAMELPPLNQFLARRLIARSRVAETLGAWRGALPANIEAIEQVLLRVSEMACELPQLREMDINPLIVDESGAVAVDARIVIESSTQGVGDYHHLAIRPYPSRHTQLWPLPGGGEYTVRPIQPDDATMLQEFVRRLLPETRYFRFISTLQELPTNLLSRFTLIDYDREMALVATIAEPGDSTSEGNNDEPPLVERIVGVSRYITNPDRSSCEFSLVVADDMTGRGLGSRLMQSIMHFAREQGLTEIEGVVLARNTGMLKLMKDLGFSIIPWAEDPDFKWVSMAL
jgi:acetyltransferase